MQSTDKKTIKSAAILLKTLDKIGVNDIFGYPGSAVLSVYDELSHFTGFNHYLFRHEQSAVHAAEGYSRVSGKCGVVLVTAGPGASNTVTGIANAFLDAYPLIVIAGQVNSDDIGKNSFQELDFSAMVKSCTKAVFKITSPDEIESSVIQAYLIANSGKKGPVVIEVPKNIFLEETEYKNLSLPSDRTDFVLEHDVDIALEILRASKRPVIVCGGGVVHSKAFDELKELIGFIDVPVVSTMMGVGAFPQNSPNYAGMIGLFGEDCANDILKSADTLLVLGARFNDRVTSAFEHDELNSKNIIQVDINSAELIRNLRADLAVNADIKDFLSLLNSKIENSLVMEFEKPNSFREIFADVGDKLTMSEVVREFSRFSAYKNIVVASEVGQHQIALIKNYEFTKPFITSGGLGAMGFGFCAAIGASIALNKAPVAVFAGDGSFQMNSQELAVCRQYGLPVKVFVINNSSLGMVRQTQEELFDGRTFETELLNPDFVKLAQSYGIEALRVENPSEIRSAFEKSFEADVPFLIEFVTDKYENV